MCGIAAIIGKEPVPMQQMQNALKAMAHRGPDGSSQWASNCKTVVIGHRRLAVRGTAEDSQPITNEMGDMAISVNGEFYGADQLRRTLEERGHVFSTTSDSEVALHLYEEFGLDFTQHLRGEFAIALWDGRRKRLIALRDRFGIKPLWYGRGNDRKWMLASEAKSIFAAGVIDPKWDSESGWHSLAHQYLPPDRSLFSGIKAIPPAHFLIYQDGKESLHSYWMPPFETEHEPDPEAVLAKLREAVSLRLEANKRPAFSLSGGLDSSAVVALASAESDTKIPAFTVSFFDGDGFDEVDQARAFTSDVGVDLTPVQVSRESMVNDLSAAVYHSEGLAINGQLVGKFMLSRAIHEAGHNVVLSGEGADEAFLGYAHLQLDAGQDGVTKSFGKQAGIMLPGENPYNCEARLPDWLERWPSFMAAKMNFADHYLPLLRDEAVGEFKPTERVETLLEELAVCDPIPTSMAFPKKAAWLWIRTAMAGYILRTLADGTEMAHSVEGRLPFLDHELFELAACTKSEANLREGSAKMVLREALRDVLPETIRTRPKHPFIAPALLSDGCPQTVLEYISDTFRSQSFGGIPFFEQAKVVAWLDGLKKASLRERSAADPALVTMLSCASLHEEFSL